MRLLLGLSLMAGGLPCCASPAATTTGLPSMAVQWQRWESALTAQKTSAQPYAEVEVDVRFDGPGGATFQVPAFWDAERGFRFRAAFPAAGVWRWKTACNDTTDTGLHARQGEVRVAASTGTNPLHRHGDLCVSPDQRYLMHADRTPFLWLGDTGWNVAVKASPAEWQEYVETRARQRFSVLQVIATGLGAKFGPPPDPPPFLADGTPDARFWRDLEQKIAVANDRGLFVLLTGLGKSYSAFAGQQRPPAFARYITGRLAGHLVILSASMDQRFDPQNHEAGARLRALTTHLVTQHPGTHFDSAKQYHDARYTDFSGLQTGHHNGNLPRAYDAAHAWTLELWRRTPVKPVINIEAMYDALGHDQGPNWREQDARKLGWITWLCGSRGYTYGAGDIPPKVPSGAGGIWRFNTEPSGHDYWRKALAWPGAAQMTHLRDFFAGIDWWRLEPAPERVATQPAEPARRVAVSHSPAGDLLVAYLPDNDEITLDPQGLDAGLNGRWFNPITGQSTAMPESWSPASPLTLRRPAGWSDAVLLLSAARR